MITNEVLSEALKKISVMSPRARVQVIKESKYGEELFMGYYFSEYIKYPFAPFHFEMFQDWRDLRDGKIRELAWIIFRESAKSSIAKVLLTKMVCFDERSYLNVDSFDKTNAENFLFDVAQNLLTNHRIISDFGQLYDRKRSTEELTRTRMDNFLTKNNVLVEAHSVAESVRGRIFGHERPSWLVLDDFETNKTKDSLAYTSATRGHIEEFASGLDAKAGILYLGNYITKTGVVQWLMDRAKEDPRIRIRMVPVIENEKPTWPSKYALTNEEALQKGKISLEDKRKQFGTVVFETEMMNNPIGSEYQVFKSEMFHKISLDDVLKRNCRVFMTIDTAISQTKNGDYTGIAINFVDMDGKWNIMSINRRMTPKELIDFIFEVWDKYKIETIGIEKTTFQMALKEFFDEEMRKRNKFPNIVDLLHGGKKKEERIRGSLLGRYESNSINHIEGYCSELEQQLLAFPNSSHDDACFVAGTKIITINGEKNIEDIIIGDKVLTRSGFEEVICSCKTGDKEVVSNIGLTGTPNHPIITKKGIKELQYVTESDTLYKWNEKLLCIEESNIIDTLNQREDNIGYIFGVTKHMEHQFPFIGKFGLITLEKYLKDSIFIIKMKIHSIILSIILRLFHRLNMQENMGTHQKEKKWQAKMLSKITRKCRKLQRYGEIQLKVRSGIKDMLCRLFANQEKLFVKNAVKKKQESALGLDSVQKNVVTDGLREISEKKILNTTETSVYNLKVKNSHEYFANGILVHNCDALSYQDQIAESPFQKVDIKVKAYIPQSCA